MTDERPVTMTKQGEVHQLRGHGSRREAILTRSAVQAPSRIPDQPCVDCLDQWASDQAGRKPVLAAALGCSALSTVVFILAPNAGVLIAGRILSGFSAGLMTGTATATLTELIPASASRRASLVATAANMGGLGLGPLIAGLFARYGPFPAPPSSPPFTIAPWATSRWPRMRRSGSPRAGSSR